MAMFSVVEGLLIDRPPVDHPASLATVFVVDRSTSVSHGTVPEDEFAQIATANRSFESIAAYATEDRLLSDPQGLRMQRVEVVTQSIFPIVGVQPIAGRPFIREDQTNKAAPVAIVREDLAERQFGGVEQCLGRTITLDEEQYEIVGVIPKWFWFPAPDSKIWILDTEKRITSAERPMGVIGRLRRGITASQAQADIAAIHLAYSGEKTSRQDSKVIVVSDFSAEYRKRLGLALIFALGPAVLVLAIACINVSSLLIGQTLRREQEYATRIALGATRARIVQQIIAENFVIVALSALIGITGAKFFISVLGAAFHAVPQMASKRFHLDSATLLFETSISVMLPLILALSPALRITSKRLFDGLRSHHATNAKSRSKRLPLVVLEIGLAMMLVLVSVLFSRAFVNIERAAVPRSDFRAVTTCNTAATVSGSEIERLIQRIRPMPTIRSASVAEEFPVVVDTRSETPLVVVHEGRPTRVRALILKTDSEFFSTVGVKVLQGPPLSAGGRGAAVSETFVRRYSANEIPTAVRTADGTELPVTHVVSDWLVDARSDAPLPTVYLPLSTPPPDSLIVARLADGQKGIPQLTGVIRQSSRGLSGSNCSSLYTQVENELAGSRLVIKMIGGFGLLALVLSSVGIYGIMNQSTIQRTHEIGIRMALGSTRPGIMKLVLGESLILLLQGILVGCIFGVSLAIIVAHELAGVSPFDPLTISSSSAVIIVAGLLASYIPAHRAANTDPLLVIRQE